ncbi:hypothetical protein TW95_gp1408 [Pandoravirus inopinatum]|uniref:Uncharacterized protein n=1 Tax=Pandoravirus inopinatum TaxID=1605721 RepID=A0A0B5JEE0_9VIRU|nr:hypothetical protein TW95_gp1408 [Pandoravirus inopinatum]AJF98142.1 hypothetical protein [Pandoravirus inopinatum]
MEVPVLVADDTTNTRGQKDTALEWRDWLALAHARGLVLRSRDYATLAPGRVLLVVPIDRAVFEHQGEAVRKDVSVPREAAAFFGPSIEVVVPTGRAWLERDHVRVAMPVACLTARWEPPKGTITAAGYHSLGQASAMRAGSVDLVEAMESTNEIRWRSNAGSADSCLCHGSGDHQTRFMRWTDVMDMPPIYVRSHTDDSHEVAQDLAGQACGSDNARDDPASPCVVVAAEVERLLSEALVRQAGQDKPCVMREIVPVWLDDAISYLDHL